jgi:hypothetical protein
VNVNNIRAKIFEGLRHRRDAKWTFDRPEYREGFI